VTRPTNEQRTHADKVGRAVLCTPLTALWIAFLLIKTLGR
jgi:hypothetical protein